MNNKQLMQRAALNSLGVLVYISVIALVMKNGHTILGEVDNRTLSPILFLLIFVCSALTTSGLVLGKPLMMYLDGQKKEAVKLLIYTGTGLFAYLLTVFLILFLTK